MRRRSVALLYALVALSALPGDAQESRSTVSHAILFVCEHGSAKSVIAAAHSNVSRGLAGDGLVVTGWKPRAVGEEDVRKADRVITFACSLPVKKSSNAVKVTDWNDVPAVSEDYAVARKAIVDRVKKVTLSKVNGAEAICCVP